MKTMAIIVVVAMAASSAGCAPRDGATAQVASKKADLHPDRDPQSLVASGRAYADAGDLVRAEQYFVAALDHGADYDKVLPLLLRVCLASNHYRYAIDHVEVALARDPTNSRLRFVSGSLYLLVGAHGTARERLEQAARELGDDPEVQFQVAAFFRDDLADKVNADRYFRHYLRIAPKGNHATEARASLMEALQ